MNIKKSIIHVSKIT